MDLKKILPENGPPINEVKKYIDKYKNVQRYQDLVKKIGIRG